MNITQNVCQRITHCVNSLKEMSLSQNLVDACWVDNLPKVKLLLSQGVDPNSQDEDNKHSAIYQACYHSQENDMKIMQCLIDAKADVNVSTPSETGNGDTCLARCTDSGQAGKVKLLLENNANPFHTRYGKNIFQCALTQFIYYRESLHIDVCHPISYGLSKSPREASRYCDYHTEDSTNYGQIVWYLQHKFPTAFSQKETEFILGCLAFCKECASHRDKILQNTTQ